MNGPPQACRSCGRRELALVLQLGDSPLANALLTSDAEAGLAWGRLAGSDVAESPQAMAIIATKATNATTQLFLELINLMDRLPSCPDPGLRQGFRSLVGTEHIYATNIVFG